MRSVLLAGSQSVWLRERAMRTAFVRRSVSRFMPGETVEEALDACRALQRGGTGTILTRLGENLGSIGEADEVRDHYLMVLRRVRDGGFDTQISVKPTQLGLDQDKDLCARNLLALVEEAERSGNFVWVDMESTPYVDPTLDLFRRARERSGHIGICLQTYLHRTEGDVEALLPLGSAIRLVKGAYREPPSVAIARKRDVDENYFRLAARMLRDDFVGQGGRLAIGTHDGRLVARLLEVATASGTPREAYEIEMLYGIQRPLQMELVRAGRPLRVLVAYGEFWFPWYMRRLAERPANVGFVIRSMWGG